MLSQALSSRSARIDISGVATPLHPPSSSALSRGSTTKPTTRMVQSPRLASAAVGWRILPGTPARNGDDGSRFRRQINASRKQSSPPSRMPATMPPFRHRMHRVMRTRRGGAGAGGGSDRRLFMSGARSGPPSLNKRRACAAPKRTTNAIRKGGSPCREGEFQSRKTPNGAPQGAIYFLTYEAACSAPSDPWRPKAEGKLKPVKATGRNRRRGGEAVSGHGPERGNARRVTPSRRPGRRGLRRRTAGSRRRRDRPGRDGAG